MPETATLQPPAQAVAETTPVTTTAVVEPASATPTPTAVPAGKTATESEVMEAIFEARTTGNGKEADRLTALLEDSRKAPAPAEPAAGAGAEQPVAEVEPAATEPAIESPAGTEPSDDLTEGKELPNRLRITHLTKEDQALQTAIHALTKGGMSLADATNRVMGGSTHAAPEIPGTQAAPVAAINPALAELESTVAAIESQMHELGERGELYGADATRLTIELSRANAKLEAARATIPIAEREIAREQGAFEAQRNQVETEVQRDYPGTADASTPFFQVYRALCVEAADPNHPDHAKAQSVDAPRYFAEKAAKILNVKPGAAKAAAPAVPPIPAAQPPPATRPAAGNKGSAPPPPAKTSADVAREAEADFENASTGRIPNTRTGRVGSVIIR